MNADDIIANDAHRDALRPSTTAFTRRGVAYPADPVGDPAGSRAAGLAVELLTLDQINAAADRLGR